MRRRQSGGTLGKYLLLLVFLALLVGFFYWKSQYGITGHIEPMPSSTKDYIAFLRQGTGGQSNIYLVRADGSGRPEPRTNDATGKLSPAWSPDGRQLCYAAEVAEGKAVTHQIFILGGGSPRQATQGSVGKLSPAWRPDGRQIAFLSGGAIKVMDPNGSDAEQIYPPVHKGGGGQEDENASPSDASQDALRSPPITMFRWSGNNAILAALQVNDEVAPDVRGQGNWWEKPQNGAETGATPDVAGPESVLLVPVSGTKPTALPQADANRISFSWFPDGKRLAVALSGAHGQNFIVVFRADEPLMQPGLLFGSRPYRVESGRGPAQQQSIAPENVAVSPDGRRIAFEVWRIDGAENRTPMGIAVMTADPDSPLRVLSRADAGKVPLVIKGRALNPQWSPDGARLLYSVPDDTGRRDLYVARADGSNPTNLTRDAKADNFDAVWSPVK